jgi:DNA-binding winged helix-turn-helix (wHTH) protein/tetratricopeptide (TPR) repeat protein
LLPEVAQNGGMSGGERSTAAGDPGPFALGPWRVEPGLNRLHGPGGEVTLEPRAMELLVCLARHAGETVSKEQLLDEVWRGAFVVEGVIPKTVHALRQALGDDAAAPRYILTVPRRGYRLLAPVDRAAAEGVAAAPQPAAPRRGLRRSGVRLALALGLLVALVLALLTARAARQPAAPRPGPAPTLEHLAVAPFEALGGGEAALLAGALRAETVTELVRYARPRVRLLAAPPGGGDAVAAARAGEADAVLLGQVASDPARVRVELQLVDPASRAVRWSGSFERPPGELLALRREIASAVAVRIGAVAAAPAAGAPAVERDLPPAVYRTFLEARHLWERRDSGDLARAHALFEQVVDEAPRFGEGHAWLALSHVVAANYLGEEPLAALAAAERAARWAVELAPDDPVAHTALGLVALNRRAAAGEAIAEYRRAISLAPSFATARQFLAEALAAAGRHDEALAAIDEAVALEPLSPVRQGVRGLLLMAAGRSREAIEQFDRALVLEPRYTWLHRYRGYALIRLGRPDEGLAALVAEVAAQGESAVGLAAMRAAVERDGLAGYWAWRLAELQRVAAGGRAPRPAQLAEALAGTGRHEAALAELARSLAAGDGEYFLYYRWSPAFDALRDRPEFEAIWARHGL